MRQRGALVIGLVAATLAVHAPPATSETRREAPPSEGRYIVVYRDSVERAAPVTRALERAEGFAAQLSFDSALEGFAARLTPRQAASLRAHPQVEFLAPDRPVQASGSLPVAEGESVPPGIRRIQAATATTTRAASSANVAVLDTGIDLAHPDLNAVHGVNCTGDGLAHDDHGHGTHVAGTIGAKNDGAGIIGVAPGTKLYAAKVLTADGSGTTSGVICAIDWVTSTRTDTDPTNDIAVANMSLGGSGPAVKSCATTKDPQHQAVCRSVDAGVTYVAAAGNSGWDFDYALEPDVPAAYPEVLTVTAMSDGDGAPGGGGTLGCSSSLVDDAYAAFSNYAATAAGSAHTVAAPGGCVRSTIPGGTYATMSGTSMAAPHVAGAVALCLGEEDEAGPCEGMTPGEIVTKIRSDAAARPIDSGFDGDPHRPVSGRYYGHLAWAESDITTPTITNVVSSPSSLKVLRGARRSGNKWSLKFMDGSTYEVRSRNKAPHVASFSARFTDVSRSLQSLRVAFGGHVSRKCKQTLSLWRWTTSSWVPLDKRNVFRSTRLIDKAVTGDLADYVRGSTGTGDLKLRVHCKRSSRFVAYGDVMSITYSY